MFVVHHLNNSRSQRILWLLEELGYAFTVRRYERDPATMLAPPELRAIHPLGKSPVLQVLEDGDEVSPVLVETGAIVEYLVDRAGGRLGAPAHREEALLYRQFLHYAEGSMMPPLLLNLALGKVPLFGRIAQRRVQGLIDVHLDFVEGHLSERPWFAGRNFTAADVMMSFPLEAARARAGADEHRPGIAAWLERIHARPAYQTALRKGGPYAYA